MVGDGLCVDCVGGDRDDLIAMSQRAESEFEILLARARDLIL
jgi:hypothetical protein